MDIKKSAQILLCHFGPEEINEGIAPMASPRRRSGRRSRRSPDQGDFMDNGRIPLKIHALYLLIGLVVRRRSSHT